MKKLPLMAAVLAVALWQAPAAVAVLHPGTHHLLWVSLYGVEVSDGMASAAASYRCNAGYADAQDRSYVFVAENTFPFDAICDGNTHLIKRKAPLPPDYSGAIAHIEIYIPQSRTNPYPGDLIAMDRETWRADGSDQIADIDVGYARLDDRGRLEVSLQYECAAGLHVPVEDDADWAYVEAYQIHGREMVWSAWKPIGHRVVCDGTRHRLVRTLRSRQDDSLVRLRETIPVQVGGILYVVGSQPQTIAGEAFGRVSVPL